MNRCEAVDVLKEILETSQIHFPNMYSLDAIKDSGTYNVRIRPNDKDKQVLRKIVLCFGLVVNEEMDILVIS